MVSSAAVKGPKDLAGKKVGVSRIGSESHNAALWMLTQNGVDVTKVTFIQSGSTIVSMVGVQQNSIDGPYGRGEGEKGLPIGDIADFSILRSLR